MSDSGAKMNADCVFCDEHQHNQNTFLENDLFRARWDLYPVIPGHAEILPLRHVQHIEDLTESELSDMLRFTRKALDIIKAQDFAALYESMLADNTLPNNDELITAALNKVKATNLPFDSFNLGLNDGPSAGQSVPHLHLHITPRWEGDVSNPRGGVRNLFPLDTYKELQ